MNLAKDEDTQFGLAMVEALRDRFQLRRASTDKLYDCTDEHMEGMAYSLTAQCEVQWSVDRPWESTDD